MVAPILNDRDMEFMLYELFGAESVTERNRYADHSKETFNAAINTARTVAEKYLLPIRSKVDTHEASFDGTSVHILPEIKVAIDEIVNSGLVSPSADYGDGGMQLPLIVSFAASAYLGAACGSIMGNCVLTNANANLIQMHGTEEQARKWVNPLRSGRFSGTMAMTEPHAGSGLSDLSTSATKSDDGTYRIMGNKIFISGGDHDLSENIVHLVLARVQGAPKGVKGISLFIVPKYLVDDAGNATDRNDVALAGIFHKMGGRGITSTALNFGEKGGAVGYLVGEENRGLQYMFHMMNEARLFVGASAAYLALAGYHYSLDYAKERTQGRLLSCKTADSPAVKIIEHPDVRRMLLQQKVYAEGAFALCMLGYQLEDDKSTAHTESERKQASQLLDILIPIIKTWSSEYGVRANYLAIQVLGGHGYINEHPIEGIYRENRLNPIHEGTTGIQSIDLLTRKVPMNDQENYLLFVSKVKKTISEARALTLVSPWCDKLEAALTTLNHTTKSLLSASSTHSVDMVFSNSVQYLNMFGNVVVAWLWMKQGIVAETAIADQLSDVEQKFYLGKLQAMRYFFRYELSQIDLWSEQLVELDSTSYDMHADWF